jgi:hypothetical protein
VKATKVTVDLADGFFLVPREPEGSFVLLSVDRERAEGLDDSTNISWLVIAIALISIGPIVVVFVRDGLGHRQARQRPP